MSGYVKAYRERFKHPLFKSQKFCRGYAWDWLVSHAVYKDHEIEVKGKIVILNRGQLSYSIRYMADAWNWDKAAVSRLLTRFKTETMIETSTETGQIIITICNYEEYQGENVRTETEDETQVEIGARQHRDRSETNKKKYKKDKKLGPDKSDLFSADRKPDKPKRKVITKHSFPEWIKPDHAQGILDQRRGKKAPVTEFWFKKFIIKMEQVRQRKGDPNAAIAMIIDKNWMGFEADWFFNNNNQSQGAQQSKLGGGSFRDQLRREGVIQ